MKLPRISTFWIVVAILVVLLILRPPSGVPPVERNFNERLYSPESTPTPEPAE
jgi:hypothetical protein